MKRRKRRNKGPVVGGMVNSGLGDTTKQGRKRQAKKDVVEMAAVARKSLKLPTPKEIRDVGQTKEH